VIASIPGEITAEAGRRVRDAVTGAAGMPAIISGLANEYASYFTTPEEFDQQHYEGAASIYGRASAVALQEALVQLASALASGQPAPAPYEFDPTNGASPAGDEFPQGADSATPVTQPEGGSRLGRIEFSWRGGPRGFDRPLDSAFVTVQRRITVRTGRKRAKGRRGGAPVFTGRVRHRWVKADSDLGKRIIWRVDGQGNHTARWEPALSAKTGLHRFVVTGNRYRLVSNTFTLSRLASLAIARAEAPSGQAAITLDYPPAVAHQDVGDPPGDFLASLTYRPQFAPSGTATVTVGGEKRRVKARDGVFTFPVTAGQTVVVGKGAARDRYGNRNDEGFSFTP
jgi:neutral ceramidase